MTTAQKTAADEVVVAPDGTVPNTAAPQAAVPHTKVPPVVVDRYEIQPDSPLPELGGPAAHAFLASEVRGVRGGLVALVGDPRLPPRLELMAALKRRAPGGILRPVHYGPVDWPPAGGQRLVVIAEQPAGRRLAPPLGESFPALNSDRLVAEVLRPMRDQLQLLQNQRIVHRSIRPDNLFVGASGRGSLVLGECYMSPPGYTQPPLFEPVERAMCHPAGRGTGSGIDDMFALGVTAAVLLAGGDPLAGVPPREALELRLARGTYNLLFERVEPPRELASVLRGLLADEPSQRWSVEQLGRFLDGLPLETVLGVRVRRADHPFLFKGTAHHSPRALAFAMSADWTAASAAVEAPELASWMKRDLGERERVEKLKTSSQNAAGRSNRAVAADLAVARTLVVLDPTGPIRMRGLAAMPDGIPGLLAAALDDQALARDTALAVESCLLDFWLEQQAEPPTPVVVELVRKCARLATYVGRAGPGYGLERCAYELNPELPCRSALCGTRFVHGLGALLAALDNVAEGDREPFDHQVAAYLAAHVGSGKSDRHLNALAAGGGDRTEALLARLRLLALADGDGSIKAPSLCRALARRLAPLSERFHNRPFRARQKSALDEAARAGRVAGLIPVIDDDSFLEADRSGFAAAKARYQGLTLLLKSLNPDAATRPAEAARLGHQLAALLAGAGATLGAGVVLFMAGG